MKKTVLHILTTGVLFAQTNMFSGNSFNSAGGDINLKQSNDMISKEEINIDRKIDNEIMKVLSSDMEQKPKNMITTLLSQSKKINQQKVPLSEKNRQCRFKAQLNAKVLKFANIKLSFSYCDTIF